VKGDGEKKEGMLLRSDNIQRKKTLIIPHNSTSKRHKRRQNDQLHT
jgi:hypothetical protein